MPLSSGMYTCRLPQLGADLLCSMQETLDEGVKKLHSIYKTFEQVGIKDRSMIWNSWVDLLVLSLNVTADRHLRIQ